MVGRAPALFAMRPDVAAAAFPAALRTRLDAVVEVDHGLIVTDFAASRARRALAGAELLLTGWGLPGAGRPGAGRGTEPARGDPRGRLGETPSGPGLLGARDPRLLGADANAYPVAQFTLSVILLAGKRIFSMARRYAEGGYKASSTSPRFGNVGRTVGVVGASRIGRLVLPMLAREGFEVLLADPTLSAAEAAALMPAPWSVELVELDDLLRRSDMVTLHAPSLPETHQLLDDRRLGLMRDGSVLVNTARGALIDTEALVRHCAGGADRRVPGRHRPRRTAAARASVVPVAERGRDAASGRGHGDRGGAARRVRGRRRRTVRGGASAARHGPRG